MIKYKIGDLIRDIKDYDVAIHGCNCFNTMGVGIALQIRKTFPQVYEEDLNTKRGDYGKIGGITYYNYGDYIIVNAYTQYGMGFLEFGVDKIKTQKYREDAIKMSFRNIKSQFGNKYLKFVFPLIGSGLAGGNWDNISKIIEKEMKDEDLTCIIWEKDIDNINKFNL